MPINPNIALGAQPQAQPINMLGQMGQLYALRAAKQDFEGGEALRDFYAGGGDTSTPEGRRALLAANPKLGSQILNQQSEMLARDVKTQADSLKTIKENVGAVNTPEAMAEYLRGAYTTPGGAALAKLIPLDRAISAIPTDPKAFADYKRNFGLTADKLFESADAQLSSRTSLATTGMTTAATMRGQDLLDRREREQLQYLTGENGFVGVNRFDPNSARYVGMMQQPGAPTAAPTTPANGLLITGGGARAAAPTLNALKGGAPNQAGAPTVANATAAATQPTIVRPPAKEPSGTMAGYRKTADGNLEFIPGGPADPAVQAQQATGKLDAKTLATREAAYPKVTSALNAFDAKTVKFERDINELIDNKKGLDEITGFLAGRTDLSAMSDAGRRALALFNTITAKGGFSELQDMRNASPTGGALGNVSNQEGKQLIDSFGALSRTQSGNDLRKSLNTALSDLQNLRQRMKEAYDLTYEYKVGRAPSSGGGAPSSGGDVIDFGSLK
jgi:hypothetical protein